MTSFEVAAIVLACMFLGTLLGILLRRALPDPHTRDDSKDIIKTASGMMATLVALIIGLLVSSSKSAFDAANANIMQAGVKIITLDRLLARYGPDARGVRNHIKHALAGSVERIWPSEVHHSADMKGFESAAGLDGIQDIIQELTPKNESQQSLKTQALQQCADLTQSRWLAIEQTQNQLPPLFLIVLVFWLTVLFLSFGLMAPRNLTAIAALIICAVSVAAAVFLILELNRPLEGSIKVSSAPLIKALTLIGK